MKYFLLLIALTVAFRSSLWANGLAIGAPTRVEQNADANYVNIKFDISWENSWRTSAEPNNWDAVWLFVKYKKASDGNWYHATLNTTDANHSTGSQGTGAILDARGDGKGAYYYRSADGTGNFSSLSVKLRWEYGTNGVSDNLTADISQVKVCGIEMCYIPQGAFYVGSGGDETNHFYTYGSNNAPYHITSEGEITVGQANGNLWADYYAENSTIPPTFPKGYNAFYCMKYEITQEQYCDFLNTLTRSQQNTRTETNLVLGEMSVTYRYVMSYTSSMDYRNGIRCDATIPATAPITFYCDFNGNGIPNEASDGQNIACNELNWADGIAYSDWSGLRPMTELEYEKVCRGSASPVANEYAWGSTSIISAGTSSSNITNSGQSNEGSNISGANCNCYIDNYIPGPLRVGCFSGGSRQSSGASYYGVMELSGNLDESCVTVGNSTGRAFTGSTGDGILDASGNGNIATCPGINANGSGFRGGYWLINSSYCRTSDRLSAVNTYSNRSYCYGFRCISGIY